MNDILTCPFCNGSVEIISSTDSVPFYRIYHACKGPNYKSEGAELFIRTKWYQNKEDAIKAWNKRKGL